MNKIVIVTGGSRGIGAATSKKLGALGYNVCVNYLNNVSAANKVVKDIIEQGGKAFAYQADVSKEREVIALFDSVEQRFGSVTHLVNNAGILFKQSSLMNMDLERFNKVIQANVISCFLCSREYIQRILALDGSLINGAIVNVSSAASRSGAPFEYIDYAASKGAMDSLTKGLSLELAGQGIRVNAVRPGFIHTDMHTDGGEPDRVDRLSSQIPLQRGGTAEEVANAIVWLLSEDASYVTESFIDIAGGK